jgi:hypothetical protein
LDAELRKTGYGNTAYEAFQVVNWIWFRKECRPPCSQTTLGVYKFAPITATTPAVDHDAIYKAVLDDFTTPGTYASWIESGSIVIPDVMTHFRNPMVEQIINHEFDMMDHHFLRGEAKPAMGFQRTMFYSIVQQAVRQDPLVYALTVATRPDHHRELISYPYVAKDAMPGESTGFLHIDCNVSRLVATGHGANALTSGISLDDETEKSCTLVVPGFHNHIGSWHDKLVERGDAPLSDRRTTTSCGKLYTAADRKEWGPPVPQPCPRFGLRLSRAEIIHGSSERSDIRRRVIFPLHTAIDEGHQRLEKDDTHSWAEIAACHRDREPPTKGVNGGRVADSLPPYAFPATVYLPSSSALGDALVGRRKWTDPEIMRDADLVLGSDPAAARAFIDKVRAKIVANMLEVFPTLVELERKAFGSDSYFHTKGIDEWLPLDHQVR